MKLATKVTLTFTVGILLVATVSAIVGVRREQELFRRDIARDEIALARAITPAVEAVWRLSGEQEAMELLDQAATRQEQIRLDWIWLDADTPLAGGGRLSPEAPISEAVEEDGAIVTHALVQTPDGRQGAVRIADPLTDEQAYMQQSVAGVAIAALVLVALCAALAWLLGTSLIGRPIRRLLEQAASVGRGDLTMRLPAQGSDELGELARQMNRMCDSLERARDRGSAESRARMEAVEQLRHAERLKTVGTLASGIAHELGTPLNVVDGYTQLIREDPASTPAITAHADEIRRQNRRMTDIVSQLMAFARRGAGSKTEADLWDIAGQVLHMVDPLARKARVRTVLEGEGPMPARIGPSQMEQVLTNLVMNALQATPSGGTVVLRMVRKARATDSRGQELGPVARIEVEDTGIGMDEETRSRIFEPFFTTKGTGEGTGLGLSVVHGIVEDHHGWIEVRSQPGRGSCFSIHLPADNP